jgi:rubrerythrin
MLFVTRGLNLIISILIYFSLGIIVQAKTLETVGNLGKAHSSELNAYNKYNKFAEKAEKDGYPMVTKLFRSVAFSELMQSRNHAAAIEGLGGKTQKIILNPVRIGTTQENLESSAKDERQDEVSMYAGFMAQAEKDGLRDAKTSFKYASDSELQHKTLFAKGLNPLGPKDVDYYVDVKSGETVEVHPGDVVPQSKLIDGTYVKAAN